MFKILFYYYFIHGGLLSYFIFYTWKFYVHASIVTMQSASEHMFESSDKERAMEMGQALINQHFGHQVANQEDFRDDDTYYRLLEDDDTTALNAGDVSHCEPRPGTSYVCSLWCLLVLLCCHIGQEFIISFRYNEGVVIRVGILCHSWFMPWFQPWRKPASIK